MARLTNSLSKPVRKGRLVKAFDGQDEDGYFCITCGEDVGDNENGLCPECEQEDAEWKQADWLDNRAKEQAREDYDE
jgi:hypothetical protein